MYGALLVVGYSAGHAIVRSWVQISPPATVYQHQPSVPSLRGWLLSPSECLAVNSHTTECTGPVSVFLQLRFRCPAEGSGNRDH